MCDRHIVLDMCDRVHENLLSLRQTENDGVILRRYDCGLLTVHHTGSLIAVLREDHTHVPVRVDWLRIRNTGTGDIGERASLKELAHDDGVYALSSFAGDCHDRAIGMALEGCPDLTVCQLTFRAKNNASCILSTCSWVGRMNRMRSRNAAYSGSTILNCWCKR